VSGPGSALRLAGRKHWPKDSRDHFSKVNPDTGALLDLRRKCIWNPSACGRTQVYCSCCMVPLCLPHFELFHTAAPDAFPAQPARELRQ
jgi:hypothetical protein